MIKTKEQVFDQANKHSLWAGHLIASENVSTDVMDNYSPIENSVIGQLAKGNEKDVDVAVQVARESFENGSWKALSPSERKTVMKRWCDLMTEHLEELAALDCVDAGKPITECLNTDMPATIETFEWLKRLNRLKRLKWLKRLKGLKRLKRLKRLKWPKRLKRLKRLNRLKRLKCLNG